MFIVLFSLPTFFSDANKLNMIDRQAYLSNFKSKYNKER